MKCLVSLRVNSRLDEFICMTLAKFLHVAIGCGGREVLLSIDRTIAPFDLVSVSNNVSEPPNLDYTAVYNFGYDAFLDSWCTDNNDRNPVVELGFTEPLLITALISGGRIESNSIPGKRSESYVTEFTLEHSITADPFRWTMYTFNNSNVCELAIPFYISL